MNKNILLLIIFEFLGGSLYAQFLRNEGKMNVSGGYLVISGNYQNESTGGIILDGIITVSGNWTNNGSGNVIDSPDTNGEVIFNGSGTQTIGGSAGIFDFEKLRINSGSTTQVTAGKGVTAYGTCTFTTPLVLKTTTAAYRSIMATFINNSTVTGNITMELSYSSTGTTASGTSRGLYFSSPISNATSTIFNVAHGTNLLWYQNETTRKYVRVLTNNTAMTVAKGYILRAPIDTVVNFTGTPNTASSYSNSNIPRAVTGQFYLFGNPYPSVIDWQAIATKTNLTNTVWYQTSSTAGTPMVVDTWNGDSQTGTNNNGTAFVDGKIPPMQSFWVQCANVLDIGTLTVEDNDRSHNWGTSGFLKSKAFPSDKERLRLYLHSGNQRDETVIILSESAQDVFDTWDSRKMLLKDSINNRGEFFTISPEKTNLVIQSVKPNTSNKVIRIGLSVFNAGEYRIVADLSETSKTNNIFLEDKKLHIMHDLVANPEYVFSSEKVGFTKIPNDTSRFVIRFLQAPTVIANSPSAVCSPQTIDLTSAAVTLGSTSGLSFTYWTDAAATIPYATPSNAGAGTYFIKGTASNGAYSISDPILVIVNTSPSVVASSPAAICSPETINLTSPSITSGSTDGLTFSYWIDKNATIIYSNPTTATNGIYYIKGTSLNGCSSISEPIEVKVNSTPIIVTTNPSPVVYPATVDLTKPEITFGSTSGLNFTYWLDVSASMPYSTPNIAVSGNYYIKGVVDNTGCSAIAGPIVVSILTTGIPVDSENGVVIYSYEKQIHINNCIPNSIITIYDIIGKQYYNGISKSDKEIITGIGNPGIYLVKVLNSQNVTSKKIYLR